MMFPVSDEADFKRPPETGPSVTPLMVIGMALVALMASFGGFQLAKFYCDAVADERRDHDDAVRRDLLRDIAAGKVKVPARGPATPTARPGGA